MSAPVDGMPNVTWLNCGFIFSQKQQQETDKLRARVTQAAVERATLLAEIKAREAALDVQEVGTVDGFFPVRSDLGHASDRCKAFYPFRGSSCQSV